MTQKSFDFPRSSRLKALERVVIHSRGPVKSILKAIDSYARDKGEAFPSVREVAVNTGFSERTIIRGLQELKALGLLCISCRTRPNGSQTSNLYVIDWQKIFDLPWNESPTDSVSPPPCHGVTPPLTPCHPLNRPLKRPSEKTHQADEFLRNEPGRKTGGWGRSITRADLRNGQTILSLWLIAVARGWITETDHWRIQFVALALACSRKPNPGGYLTTCLRKKEFKLATCDDVDEARQIVKRFVHREPEQRAAVLSESEQEVQFVSSRDKMVARLRQMALAETT